MRPFGFIVLAVSTIVGMQAQTPLLSSPGKALPQFAVATVKPGSAKYIGLYVKGGGRVSGGLCPVSYLVTEAFHVPRTGITGGPKWIDSERFDIEAVPPDDSAARTYQPVAINSQMIDEQRLMLQALLRDRFGLQYHVEKQEQPVYFLERSGKALKLFPPKDPKGFVAMSVITYSGGKGNGEVEGINTTMAFTALRLSQILQRTVVDRTELSGAFDFHVDAPDEENADIPNATFEGMKALGLELKPGRALIDTIVIDEVREPTPN